MYAGRIVCCSLVSHGEFADGTDRQTDERTSDRYITLSATRGQHKNGFVYDESLKPRPHQQQCRSNRQRCRSYVRLCRSNIRLCCHKWQQCRTKFSPFDKVETNRTYNVEATFDIVERIVKLVAFDSVAWTLLLVWTGLKMRAFDRLLRQLIG